MRKLLAIVLVIMLAFSCMSLVTAFAEETVVTIGASDATTGETVTDGAETEDDSLAARVTRWLESKGIPQWLIPFIVSIFPILELRGGIVAAKIVGMKLVPAFLICFVGNMLPIPFVLLFIKKIFNFFRLFNCFRRKGF